MMAKKTSEEIEALKASWMSDPIWDIENTEGFEDHRDELFAWRMKYEAEQKARQKERDDLRAEKIMNVTGLGKADKETLLSLWTWAEIESRVAQQENYMGDFSTRESIVMAELAQAQIRATLLLAAQMKRIADALENMDDGDAIIRSAKIYGE